MMYETISGIHISDREAAMLGAESPLSRPAARQVIDRVTAEMVAEAAEIGQLPDPLSGPRFNKIWVQSAMVAQLSDIVLGSVADGAETFLRDLNERG